MGSARFSGASGDFGANGRMVFPLIVLKDGPKISGTGDRAVRRHCVDSRAVQRVSVGRNAGGHLCVRSGGNATGQELRGFKGI